MTLDVLLDHVFGDIPCTPGPVPDRPEVSAPVAFPEMREFVLQEARRSPLEALHDVGDGEFGRVLHVHVDVIGADGALEDADIFTIADLDEKFPTPFLHLTREDVVAVLRHPDHVYGHPRERMATMPVGVGHSRPC